MEKVEIEKKFPWSIVFILSWAIVSYFVNIRYYELSSHKFYIILLFLGPLVVSYKRAFFLFILWLPNFFFIETKQFVSIAVYILLFTIIRLISIRYNKKDVVLIISNHFISNFASGKLHFGIFDVVSTLVLFVCLFSYLSN